MVDASPIKRRDLYALESSSTDPSKVLRCAECVDMLWRRGVHAPAIGEELEMRRIREDMLASASKHARLRHFLVPERSAFTKAARRSSPVDATAWQSPLL
eukprot:12989015-Alexandrium_andersonii.AAC.1